MILWLFTIFSWSYNSFASYKSKSIFNACFVDFPFFIQYYFFFQYFILLNLVQSTSLCWMHEHYKMILLICFGLNYVVWEFDRDTNTHMHTMTRKLLGSLAKCWHVFMFTTQPSKKVEAMKNYQSRTRMTPQCILHRIIIIYVVGK